MSLFKIRDIWSTQVNKVNSSHDEFCLKLSPLYKLNALQHFILVGTSSGMLSIFLPRAGDYTNADDFGYPSQHYNDLCLEYNMDEPILSIDCGSLNVELCQYQQIAVLHPQMVSVYSFTKSEDSIQEGDCETFSFDSWRLTSLFKHDLKKPSFNMSVERYFTHTQTDIILVQSIDASLCFFNLYGALFEITLGNILIPGPIVFLNSTQSLLTSDSRKLYCFSFMYSSTEHSRILYDENKNISLDWSLLFEEPIFNMQKIDSIYTATSRHSPLSYIIALGRRRVFLISETGSLLSTRRIDASPKHLCMYGYAEVDPLIAKEDCSGSNMQCMLTWQPRYLVTTEKNQLLVFKGTELLWSALLPFYQYRLSMPINTPPSNRCDSKTLPVIGEHFPPGLIVLLNSNGRITLSYLGTDPSELVASINIFETISNTTNDAQLNQLNTESFNRDMQQLNKRIDQLKDNYSSLLLNGNYDKHKQFKNIPLLKLKTNIRRDSFKQSNEIGSQVCFIDVKVEFPKKYPREQFTSVYLLTHSCPPTMINPNYIYISSNQLNNHDINLKNHTIPYIYSCTLTCSGIMNNDNDDDIGQNVRTPLHSNQLPLDTIVILMLYYTFSQVNSNNNISSSPLNHSTTKCIKKCIKIPLCLFTSSTIVSKDEIEGKFALTFRLLSRLNNLKDNLHLSNLFPNLWPQNYTTGLNDSSINNKQQDSTICVSFCKSKGIVERSVQCIYISIKLQKCQLKLKSNYPETFWPILQELVFYNNLITELKKGNINNNNAFSGDNHLHMVLCKNKEVKDKSDRVPRRTTSLFYEYALQIEPFFDQLYVYLVNHMEKRVQLINEMAKLTIQTRHFHDIQMEIIERTKNNLPDCLHGFDILLKRDLTNVSGICDSLENLTEEYIQTGISVISLVVLLSFICLFCKETSYLSSLSDLPVYFNASIIEEQLNLFEPAHMMSILNSTRLLENSQDIQLPEKILSSEIYAKNIHFGLEEYLQAKINYFIGIINLKYTNLNRKTNIPTDCENQVHLNYDKLSTVETIHKQFYHLCRDFMSCDYKDVITDLIQSTIVNSRGK